MSELISGKWDEIDFTSKGFGVHRVYVPLIILEQDSEFFK